jgi:hypothetical protein
VPEEVNGGDGGHRPAGARIGQTAACSTAVPGEEPFELAGVELPVPRVGVEGDGVAAGVADRVGGRHEGPGGHDDSVSGPYPGQQERDVQRWPTSIDRALSRVRDHSSAILLTRNTW